MVQLSLLMLGVWVGGGGLGEGGGGHEVLQQLGCPCLLFVVAHDEEHVLRIEHAHPAAPCA